MAQIRRPGAQRQKRIKQAQHRPEQNAGYDEAVRGGKREPKLDVMTTSANPDRRERPGPFDREARAAATDVRRRERSSR